MFYNSFNMFFRFLAEIRFRTIMKIPQKATSRTKTCSFRASVTLPQVTVCFTFSFFLGSQRPGLLHAILQSCYIYIYILTDDSVTYVFYALDNMTSTLIRKCLLVNHVFSIPKTTFMIHDMCLTSLEIMRFPIISHMFVNPTNF